jgi:hypothetical protein
MNQVLRGESHGDLFRDSHRRYRLARGEAQVLRHVEEEDVPRPNLIGPGPAQIDLADRISRQPRVARVQDRPKRLGWEQRKLFSKGYFRKKTTMIVG